MYPCSRLSIDRTILLKILVVCCLGTASITTQAQDRSYYDRLSFSHPDEILKLDSGVYQSLPGVYRVHTSGTFRIECPASIEVDMARLNAEMPEFRQRYTIDSSIDDPYVRWLQVAKHPERYLKPSANIAVFQSFKHELGTGSCFAIDRAGILLTNRHVVSSDPRQPMDFDQLMGCEPEPLIELIKRLVKELGDWTGEGSDEEFVQTSILSWFAAQSIRSTQVTEIKIAVAYSHKSLIEKSSNPPLTPGAIVADLFEFEPRVPKLLPATILAMGSEEHANDLAILKLTDNASDALICLNLARPEEVREESRVFSLGFPGYRYDFANLTTRDMQSVTLQGGKVVRKPKKGNLNLGERLKVKALGIEGAEDLLFVSAYMNCGSSGGPIILADGSVAGMTVCGKHVPDEKRDAEIAAIDANTPKESYLQRSLKGSLLGENQGQNSGFKEEARSYFRELTRQSYDQNMAIPLENILAFLQLHGIQPDPGPTTKDWHEALALYRSEKFREAAAKLESIANRQVCVGKSTAPFDMKVTVILSHYVAELRELATEKGGK